MTDSDVQCYKDRYSDISYTDQYDIKKHYDKIGKEQGRLNTCANNITDYQAKFLLEKTPALQRLYGSDIEKVRTNYTLQGSQASTKYDVSPGTGQLSPMKCGTDIPNTPFDKHKCGCEGTIYYGL